MPLKRVNIRRIKSHLGLALLGLWLCHKASGSVQVHHFPEPEPVREQVRFWEAVFDKYPSHMAIIHDTDHPSVIIDIIDYKEFARKLGRGPLSNKEKSKLSRRYVKRYMKALERIAKEGSRALSYGAMEKRVYKVYGNHREARKELFKAKAAIRLQTGLADEFSKAAVRAQKFLPYMEAIFRKKRLPIELTRIVFVESMFNTNALSKVGASGVWQFMPATGRRFLTVNRWIDERNSPIKATRAAADLLKDNYQILKSWPLAITAYNHGAGGMLRATKQTGTSDFGVIVRQYKSNSFGFASRNFYGEYLAARNIYRRRYHNRFPKKPNPLGISSIKIKEPTSLATLINQTPLTASLIKSHNLCLSDAAFSRYYHRTLPAKFELLVPSKFQQQIRRSLESIAQTRRSNRSRSL